MHPLSLPKPITTREYSSSLAGPWWIALIILIIFVLIFLVVMVMRKRQLFANIPLPLFSKSEL